MSDLTFLPWMRGGLGVSIATAEPKMIAGMSDPAAIVGRVEVNGRAASADISLRPPHHVTALDTTQITRRYPTPGVEDAEYGYFPHIEFVAADLPWAASPHSADETSDANGSTGRLRPWLALVCFDATKGALSAGDGTAPQFLSVDADELPDLEECWAWAHVQSLVPAEDTLSAVLNPDGSVIARLVCPRKLAPSTQYRAALVNVWAQNGDGMDPAWTAGGGTVSLKVYDTWTFGTGLTGSFEELVERLEPAPGSDANYGLQAMDLSTPGMIDPIGDADDPARADFTGALRKIGAVPGDLGKDEEPFKDGVKSLLEYAGLRRDMSLSDPDPVVTLPYYGSFPHGAAGVPQSGWLPELNYAPRWRAAAGLGAALVRQHQECLMAQAWDQVGQIRETNRLLSRATLRRSVAESWKAKAAKLDPAQVMGVLRAQLTFLRDDANKPLRQKLRDSTVPNGTVSAAMARAVRPSFVVQKSLTAPERRGPVPGDEVIGNRDAWREMLRDALDTPAARGAMNLEVPRAPNGIRTSTKAALGAVPKAVEPVSLSGMARTVGQSLKPAASTLLQVELRVPAMASILAKATSAPSRVTVGPIFGEAMATNLMELSPELLMPGVKDVPKNSAMLVEADTGFAAALLAGANHEMIRELLWREYPADLRHTCFQRFWPRPDPNAVDVKPMISWDLIRPLNWQGAASGESVVLLVRGDLIRQFPSARFLLVDPAQTNPMDPSFSGHIPPDIGFFGFDVANPDAVTAPGSEWLVIIEEPAFEPRFGLDTGPSQGKLQSYSELAWADLTAQTNEHLALAPEVAIASNGALKKEAEWGLNSAHMARITHQQPVRWLCNAVDLLGSGL